MDLSVIFQLRTKKFWWMDVIFYFVISLLVATLLCYLIFLVKNGLQRSDIKKESAALQTVGTTEQKRQEQSVIGYQKKINDFSSLLKSHEFASNVFAFMQTQTLPNIWFKQFNLDAKNNSVQLSGESDNLDAFSRQIAAFEGNKYVKSIGTLSSTLGQSAKVDFNMALGLDQNIFSYIASAPPILETTATTEQLPEQPEQATPTTQPETPVTTPLTPATPAAAGQPAGPAKNGEKLITSFHLLLIPEVVGVIDQTNFIVTLTVPSGTDVKNLTSSIVISPGATVLPESNLSQNFTNPVAYLVAAQDGTLQNYTVKVIVIAPWAVVEKTSKPSSSPLIIILLVGIIIIVSAVIFFFVWKKIKGPKPKL